MYAEFELVDVPGVGAFWGGRRRRWEGRRGGARLGAQVGVELGKVGRGTWKGWKGNSEGGERSERSKTRTGLICH